MDPRGSAEEHAQVWASIPWCVAGSASDSERERALAHVGHCADCRREWALNLRWREALGGLDEATPAEAMAAEASLAALWRRIDGDAAMAVPPTAAAGAATMATLATGPRPLARRTGWVGVLAVASLLQAVGLVALATLWWQGSRVGPYETLSREAPAGTVAPGAPAPAPELRIQLAPGASDAEAQALAARLALDPAVRAIAVQRRPAPAPTGP